MAKHIEGIRRMIDRQQEEARKAEVQKELEVASLFAERARVHVRIMGKVQGVFFRAFVEKAANDFRLVGYVKNQEDGSVEFVAEGEKAALEQLIRACREGPAWASIEDVSVTWELYTGEFGNFEVR